MVGMQGDRMIVRLGVGERAIHESKLAIKDDLDSVRTVRTDVYVNKKQVPLCNLSTSSHQAMDESQFLGRPRIWRMHDDTTKCVYLRRPSDTHVWHFLQFDLTIVAPHKCMLKNNSFFIAKLSLAQICAYYLCAKSIL